MNIDEIIKKPDSLDIVLNPGETSDGQVFVHVTISDPTLTGKRLLRISGVIGPKKDGNATGSCGQIVDSLLADGLILTKGWTLPMVESLVDVWKNWHLNDMNAACTHQKKLGWTYQDHHDPKTFKGENCPVCGYSIGSAWLHEPLPLHVIQFLHSLPASKKVPAWI